MSGNTADSQPLTGARLAAAKVLRYGGMLFLTGVLVQFYLAGRGIFAAAGPVHSAAGLDAHRVLGNVLAGLAVVLLVAAAVAHPTRRLVAAAIVLFVLTGLEGVLAGAGTDSPSLAGGLHVVVALLVFGLGLELVNGTRHLVPGRR